MGETGGKPADVVFEGSIKAQSHLMFPLVLTMLGKDLNDCMGIIDTGSPQCLLNPGAVDETWFEDSTEQIGMRDALANEFISRGVELIVRLESKGVFASFPTLVYEMPLGSWPYGSRVMLVGRTLLKQGRFVFDGLNSTWCLSFPQNANGNAIKV